jgi:hypothetical protein
VPIQGNGIPRKLKKYQLRHGLPPTGEFDEATRAVASMSRCGMPDVIGGIEFSTGSGNYSLLHEAAVASGQQSNWRWCNKCQGLFFGGNAGSVCPAGGPHSKVGSGNYSLIHR